MAFIYNHWLSRGEFPPIKKQLTSVTWLRTSFVGLIDGPADICNRWEKIVAEVFPDEDEDGV